MTLTFDLEIWFKVTVHPLPDRYSEGHPQMSQNEHSCMQCGF